MTSGSRPRGTAPPYGSYKSWETFVAYVKTDLSPLPERLDSSVWRNTPFSGSTRSAIQGALMFFGLADPQGKTHPRLDMLANAQNDEAKRRLLGSLFDEKYGPLLEGIDLPRATRGQVKAAFQSAGSGMETSEKAVSFFVSFASEAGKGLHPGLFGRNQGTRTRRKSASSRKELAENLENSGEIPKSEIVSEKPLAANENGVIRHEGVHPALLAVLSALPGIGESWTNSDREKLKLAFSSLLDLTYPTLDDTSRRML